MKTLELVLRAVASQIGLRIHIEARLECVISSVGERPEYCIGWRVTDD